MRRACRDCENLVVRERRKARKVCVPDAPGASSSAQPIAPDASPGLSVCSESERKADSADFDITLDDVQKRQPATAAGDVSDPVGTWHGPRTSDPSAQYTREPPEDPPDREERAEREAQVNRYLSTLAGEEEERGTVRGNRSVALTMARNKLFLAQVEEVAHRVFKDKLTPPEFKPKKPDAPVRRHVHILLSDLHFGSLLDPREVPHQYGHVEEARRFAAVIAQAADYKPQYREETDLHINLLGDIIQNQLHDPRDGAPLAQQWCAALHLLRQGIAYLAGQFSRVHVRATPGNHGRSISRHRERAINQKWDALETMLYHALRVACEPLTNVRFEIPLTPFFTYQSFGRSIFATHGDTVVMPGSPWKTINVANLERQINRINAALPDASEFGLFLLGHVHFGANLNLPNGANVITNGCLLPPDAFAVSNGALEVACGQTLWESVPGHVVGDYRYLRVGPEQDRDSVLDALIKPFPGM